jgi:hypothetical protein
LDDSDEFLHFDRRWTNSVVVGRFLLALRVEFGASNRPSGSLSPNSILGPSSELPLALERFCRRRMRRVVTGCFTLALGINSDGIWRLDGRVLADLVIFGALAMLFFPHFALSPLP